MTKTREKFGAVDVGATNTRVAEFDSKGKILHQKSFRTDPKDIDGGAARGLKSLGETFRAIGISSAGALDEKRRSIVRMGNTDANNIPIVETFEKTFKTEVSLFNDMQSALIAVKFGGEGKDYKNIIYMTFSTGIGSAVMDNGRLVFGKDGNAGQIGHQKIEYNGGLEHDACGQTGCVEAFIGGKNIGKAALYLRKAKYQGQESELDRITNTEQLTAEKFFKIAETDPVAKRIQDELGKIFAVTVGSMANMFDPEIVIMGGSVMLNNQKVLMGYISRLTPDYVEDARMPKLVVTKLGDEICLVGAALGAINNEWIRNNFFPKKQ